MGDMYKSLAFDVGACLFTFLEGLTAIVCLSCQSRYVFNLLHAVHITSSAYFSEALALADCLNHSGHFSESTL